MILKKSGNSDSWTGKLVPCMDKQCQEYSLESNDAGEKKYTCKWCQETRRTKKRILRHINKMHMYNLLICKKCEAFSMHNSNSFNKHTVACGVKYECETCGKKCVSKSNLNHHTLLHKAPAFSCTVCKKSFLYKWLYMRHKCK